MICFEEYVQNKFSFLISLQQSVLAGFFETDY